MSNNPPGYEKDNPLTRAIARVAQINSMHGMRAQGGGMSPGDFPSLSQAAQPLSSYDPRNAPIGPDDKPMPVVSNLDPNKQEELDRQWASESGQRVGSAKQEEDDGIGGHYGSLDEARPVRRMTMQTGSRGPTNLPIIYKPAVMDFTKLQSVSFEDSTVVIDGVGFKVTDECLLDIKNFAVGGVLDAIKANLEKALSKPIVESSRESAAIGEGVQPVPPVETADGVSQAQPEI